MWTLFLLQKKKWVKFTEGNHITKKPYRSRTGLFDSVCGCPLFLCVTHFFFYIYLFIFFCRWFVRSLFSYFGLPLPFIKFIYLCIIQWTFALWHCTATNRFMFMLICIVSRRSLTNRISIGPNKNLERINIHNEGNKQKKKKKIVFVWWYIVAAIIMDDLKNRRQIRIGFFLVFMDTPCA